MSGIRTPTRRFEFADGQALTPMLAEIADTVRRELAWRFDSESKIGLPGNTREIVLSVAQRVGFDLNGFEIDQILSQLESDWQIFGILQPLVNDVTVTDIIVARYTTVNVQRNRRNLRTSVSFADQRSYEVFIERLLARAGTVCTTKQPIADGMIGPQVRIHVVHQSLCDDGPYLTIRINRFSSVSAADLVMAGLAPQALFDYLRGIVIAGKTILVVGEVGTGKTTLARALAGAIPEDESILVIEDTPEIRLTHPHVRYVTTRCENAEGVGRVAPAQCIRAGMRMAMNRIVFGEIRDAEAAEAFVDVCTSGHSGVSTLHGRTISDALTRLELFLGRAQRGAEREVLIGQIVAAIQVVVLVDLCPQSRMRRVLEVREIGPVGDGVIRGREIFLYRQIDGLPSWRVTSKVSAFRERLETLRSPVRLSQLPSTLELPLESNYFELARG